MARIQSFFHQTSLCVLFLIVSTSIFAQLSWQKTSSIDSIPTFNFSSFDQALYACTFGGGIFKTTDEGENWTPCPTGLPTYFTTDITHNESVLFVATKDKGVFKSDNKGISWEATSSVHLYPDVRAILMVKERLFAGTANGIYYSDNEGTDWQKANMTASSGHHSIIKSLATDGIIIMAGTNSGIYLSKDFGQTWQSIALPTLFDVTNIIHQNGQWLLSTSGDGLFSSLDGVNWDKWQNDNTENVRALILAEAALVMGSSEGVIGTGENISTGLSLTSPTIRSLAYHNGKLYAGTYRQGIWRYDSTPTNFVPPNTSRQLWKAVHLYPNPVNNGLITIEYRLEEASQVAIQLYDSFGKQLSIITPPTEQDKGFHQITHSLNQLIGGTYYLKFQLGDDIISKPIMVLK